MRYVIIRDDDTNALTPAGYLERLYRPFLERGLPVNLAVIPEVATDATMANGRPEGFLLNQHDVSRRTLPIGGNIKLARYLLDNPGYYIVQHGCYHDYLEFDQPSSAKAALRLDHGMERLMEAGFLEPATFVAPYDRLSRAAYRAVARRFRVVSTGWFELRRLPFTWWPNYAFRKMRGAPHWRVGHTLLLSHPGCLLSCHRDYSNMLDGIIHWVQNHRLTVLVTHWWEYFRNDQPDEPFIEILHKTAEYLATQPELKVISFGELVSQSRVCFED